MIYSSDERVMRTDSYEISLYFLSRKEGEREPPVGRHVGCQFKR